MGCANTKAGGATGAYGAPEEEGANNAAPKVMVDGEGQDGGVTANGNAVSCANGVEEETTAGEKENCNGDLSPKNEESQEAPSGEDKSDQNGDCDNEEAGAKSIQDGGGEAEDDIETEQTEEEENKDGEVTADTDTNAESRETNDEEKAE